MQIKRVRRALADVAKNLPGWENVTVSPIMSDMIEPPAFIIGETMGPKYNVAYRRRAAIDVTFRSYFAVSHADDETADDAISDFLSGAGPLSVATLAEAVEARNPAGFPLGGACDVVDFTEAEGHRWYTFGHTEYVGATVLIRCVGAGDGVLI